MTETFTLKQFPFTLKHIAAASLEAAEEKKKSKKKNKQKHLMKYHKPMSTVNPWMKVELKNTYSGVALFKDLMSQ